MSNCQLLLLPGMDGTGRLFRSFLEQLDDFIDYRVVSYPTSGKQDYETLTDYVLTLLSDDKQWILLAESFSGPIAYKLARTHPHIKGIIFAASFLQNPRPFISLFRKLVPFQTIMRKQLPKWFIKNCLLGQTSSDHIINEFYSSLQETGTDVLKQRLNSISQHNIPDMTLNKPCIYLQASNDYFVPKSVISEMKKLCYSLTVHKISGTHFILQSSPEQCSIIIKNVLKSMLSIH